MESREKRKRIKKKLNEDKVLVDYDTEELEYVQKPLGKAHFKSEPKKKTHWSDRVKCDVCNKEFTRSARSQHKKTQVHQVYAKMNKKLQKLLIDS